MVACPHCQFENPVQNRYCQRCGNVLKGLRAIVLPATGSTAASDFATEKATTSEPASASLIAAEAVSEPGAATLTVADLLTADQHLPGGQRYQLRRPEAAKQALAGEVILEVLDDQPAAASPWAEQLEATREVADEAEIGALLPPMAFPYWKLQEHCFPMVPELQDAWQAKNFTFIVLEDRSHWPTPIDWSKSSEVEALELVHWFYEVVNLWQALTAFNAEASLLDRANLRIDDDQIFCIQRLIYNAPGMSITLRDLGAFWEDLLQEFPNPTPSALANLVADIGAGVITDPATIVEILATIAENLEDESTVPVLEAVQSTEDTDQGMAFPLEAILSTDTNEVPALPLNDFLLTGDLSDFEANEGPTLEGLEDSLNDLPTMALPMKLTRLDEVGRTHVGRQRTHNEDFFFAETQLKRTDSPLGNQLEARGLYILCDGMGGHSGGEVASALAVSSLRDYFQTHWQADLPDEATVKEAILKTNQAIFAKNEAEGRTGSARMGTTLVMVLITDSQAVVAHVGDSRLYCLTRQGLHQATVDHEVGQREIKRGVEPAIAYARPDAYQLTQALGPRDNNEVAPTISTLPITQDTLFLLCSDGLSDNDLLETHFESHVEPLLRSRSNLEDGVASLIDLANEHNGHDNITVIAVRVKMQPNLEVAQVSVGTTLPWHPVTQQPLEPD